MGSDVFLFFDTLYETNLGFKGGVNAFDRVLRIYINLTQWINWTLIFTNLSILKKVFFRKNSQKIWVKSSITAISFRCNLNQFLFCNVLIIRFGLFNKNFLDGVRKYLKIGYFTQWFYCIVSKGVMIFISLRTLFLHFPYLRNFYTSIQIVWHFMVNFNIINYVMYTRLELAFSY